MGIIKNLKGHYKLLLAEDQVNKEEKKLSMKIDLLDAIRILKKSWNLVKPETIRNWFRKARFVIEVNLVVSFLFITPYIAT